MNESHYLRIGKGKKQRTRRRAAKNINILSAASMIHTSGFNLHNCVIYEFITYKHLCYFLSWPKYHKINQCLGNMQWIVSNFKNQKSFKSRFAGCVAGFGGAE